MRTSGNTNELMPKLLWIINQLEPLTKDKDNPYFKSKYADHEQAWAATKELLKENELVLTQGGKEGVQMAITANKDGKAESYPTLTVITRITHAPSGQYIETDCPLVLAKADPQGSGSAWTYGRRYGLEGILNMARQDADDDGNKATKPRTSKPPTTKKEPVKKTEGTKLSPEKGISGYISNRKGSISVVGKDGKGKGQLGYLFVMMRKHGVDEGNLREHVNETYEYPEGKAMVRLRDLNTPEMNEVLEWMEEQKSS